MIRGPFTPKPMAQGKLHSKWLLLYIYTDTGQEFDLSIVGESQAEPFGGPPLDPTSAV